MVISPHPVVTSQICRGIQNFFGSDLGVTVDDMVFPADAVAGWECVRAPDAVPSAEYRYDLFGYGEDAMEQCERDLHAWFAALREHGQYDVQIGIRYVQQEHNVATHYHESEPIVVRVPLTAVDRQTLGGALRPPLNDSPSQEGTEPSVVYLKIWGRATSSSDFVLDKRTVREKRMEEERARKVRGERKDGTKTAKTAGVRKPTNAGKQKQRAADPSVLLRAVAMAMHPTDQPTSKRVSDAIDRLLVVVATCADDEARMRAMETECKLQITVWASTKERLRAPTACNDATAIVHLVRDEAGAYQFVTDVTAFVSRHPTHACEHCKVTFATEGELRKHRASQACLRCPDCEQSFRSESFDNGLAALCAHREAAVHVPCVEKASRDKDGAVVRIGARSLPAHVNHEIVVDIEAVPSHGTVARGVAIRRDESGAVRPIEKIESVGARRALKITYVDGEVTRAPPCEGAPKATVALGEAETTLDEVMAPLRVLEHGDTFEVDGCCYLNRVGADRHTDGDQLATMVCFRVSGALERKLKEMRGGRTWERTADGEYRTKYRETDDGVPLLGMPILDAAIDFLDDVDAHIVALGEKGARWWARCQLLAEWWYCVVRGNTHGEFKKWCVGKILPFWKELATSFVMPALKERGVTHVNERLDVRAVSRDGAEDVRQWLEDRREQYDKEVQKKMKDSKGEKVTVLAHNGSGYDYYQLLKAMLARGARGRPLPKPLENNNRVIQIEYGRFSFHDSVLQIQGSLAKLAKDFGADTGGMKGCAPHAWYATTEDRAANWPNEDFTNQPAWYKKWSNADLVYKPARRFFVEPITIETRNGAKIEGVALQMSPEDYRSVPGKDPEGDLHGEGYWNSYRYVADYCALDVRVLADSVWAKWRAAVLNATRVDGVELHPTLATAPITVLSLDPGWHTGVCVLHYNGHWELRACGTVSEVTPANAETKVRAALRGWSVSETVDVALIELQPYWDPKDKKSTLVDTNQWRRMEALQSAFDARRVDPGYAKQLEGVARGDDNKEWALRAAPAAAEQRGLVLPLGIGHDAADAFLQAVWWIEAHTAPCVPCASEEEADEPASHGEACVPASCLCCVRRYATKGLDASSCLTISQLSVRSYKTDLVAELPPLRQEDAETRIVVWKRHYAHRARYMPQDGLAAMPRAEDQMMRAAMRGGRTDTGALLYEIDNPCRCPVVNGRREWRADCGAVVAPDACPECGSNVEETRRNFECTECEWTTRKPKRGVPERIESWDVRSEYPACLMGALPVPNGKFLSESEIAALDPETFLFTSEGEAHFWLVTCDFEANPTDLYPIVSTKRKLGDAEKLVFDNADVTGTCDCGASPPCFVPHGPTCTHDNCNRRCHGEGETCALHSRDAPTSTCAPALTLCCPELRVALKSGCRIKKLHRVLRYAKADYVESWIEDWAAIKNRQDELKSHIKKAKAALEQSKKGATLAREQLREIGVALDGIDAQVDADGARAVVERHLRELEGAENPAMRAAAKLILNSLFGRTLMRERDTETLIVDAAERLEKRETWRSRFVSEKQLSDDVWVVTLRKGWKPSSGLPCAIGVFCLSKSKVILWNGVTRCIERGGTWLGGDTDCVTVALLHGVEFPLELQGERFGDYERDYSDALITGWANPILKGYAYRFGHNPVPYVAPACAALRAVIGTWLGADAERAVLEAITPCLASDALRAVLLRDDVRASLLAAIQANRSPELTHALVDLIGPETMKMKGASVNDNLARL